MALIIAGLASGMFMAHIFITVGCVTMFFALKDPPPAFAVMLARFPPGVFVMSMVILSYPVWAIIGTTLALVFLASQNAVPGAGLGSPNLVYTVGVSVATILLALPMIILAGRLWTGVACIALFSIATFGWMLPHFAS